MFTSTTKAPAKKNVVGVNISATSYTEVVDVCARWIEERAEWQRQGGSSPASSLGDGPPPRYITVTSVHGIVTAREEPKLRQILNAADIATPDGMPVVWALRSFGQRDQARVYGPTLTAHLCEDAAARGHRIFLYGAREDTLQLLEQRLTQKFPGLKIAGHHAPPFRPLTPEEDAAVIQQIRESNADLIFVGISTPKQEYWMWDHRQAFPGSIMIGVGAAFDFHAGTLRQAPSWMQSHGLEWLFRLTAEPARLWKRYLLVTPRFLPFWALQKIGLFPAAQGEDAKW